MATISSSPDAPSMAAWCTFVSRPDLAVVEAVDDPHLPQRAGAVERDGDQLGGQVAHVGHVAVALGHGDVAEVPVEVEVGVLDPERVVDAERHLDQPAAERRGLVEPGRVEGADPIEGEPARQRCRRRPRSGWPRACRTTASPSTRRCRRARSVVAWNLPEPRVRSCHDLHAQAPSIPGPVAEVLDPGGRAATRRGHQGDGQGVGHVVGPGATRRRARSAHQPAAVTVGRTPAASGPASRPTVRRCPRRCAWSGPAAAPASRRRPARDGTRRSGPGGRASSPGRPRRCRRSRLNACLDRPLPHTRREMARASA